MSRQKEIQVNPTITEWVIGTAIWVVIVLGLVAIILKLNPPTPRSGEIAQPNQQHGEHPQDSASVNERGPFSSPFVVRIEKTEEDRQSAEKNERQADENAALNRRQATFNGLLALFAAAQFVIILLQWRINRGQLKTQRAELRAYVSADIISLSRLHVNTPSTFIFECINHGKTPAKDVEFRAVIDIAPHGDASLIDLRTIPWRPRQANLFPNAEEARAHSSQIRHSGRIFTPQEIDQIRSGTHYVYIGIEIQYWDFMDNAGRITRNYFRVEGHPAALQILTMEGHEGVEITGLPKSAHFPEFRIIPGLSRIT